ncbi:MAG: AMP-binding protein [Cyclobacteriaceae bacterium]
MVKKKLTITFPKEGFSIQAANLADRDISKDTEVIQKVAEVCKWWSETDLPLTITTSGSTGTPKKFNFTRTAVKTSVRMTTEALGLEHGMNSLLALNPSYIGGRMMIVRALSTGMNLICTSPGGNPLEIISDSLKIDFASFVPIQIEKILSNPKTAEKFSRIGRVLIGGAPIGAKLKERLSIFPNKIYQTFGMTETLSHIALKNLTENDSNYIKLPGVTIYTDDRGCLVAEIPGLLENRLVTNDLIIQENEKTFKWIGRIDRMINSGGIKISPELLEEKCQSLFEPYKELNNFFFHWQSDDRFGQKVVLVLTGRSEFTSGKIKELTKVLDEGLENYENPKAIFLASEVLLTPGGKMDYQATFESARQIWP